jgi:hypothetical protein
VTDCLRKRPFDSEGRAWSAIFTMRARGQDTERLTPKECEHCKRWHLARGEQTAHTKPARKVRDVLPRESDA